MPKMFIWMIVSIVAWLFSLVMLRGTYPDWDDAVASRISVAISGILMIIWILWLITIIFSKNNKKLNLWFKIGVCFAVLMSLVRLFFLRQVFELFDFLFKSKL